MKRFRNLFRLPAFHGFLACLGFVLIGWPVVTIADRGRGEATFLYLFTVWALLIIVMFIIAKSLARQKLRDRKTGEEGK